MKKIILALVLLSLPVLAFSAESSTQIKTFIPQKGSGALEDKIDRESKIVQEIYGATFLAYDALRDDDISVCGSNQNCLKIANGGFEFKLWAEGRCGEIRNKVSSKLCEDVNNNCANLSGWEANFCRAFINGDASAMGESLKAADAREARSALGGAPKVSDSMWMLALYSGFKYFNSVPCQSKLSKGNFQLEEKLVCPYVFANNVDIKNDIIRDLALSRLAKEENDVSYCDLIKVGIIKNDCLKQ